MNRIYFTLTGTNHRYGSDFIEPRMTVRLVKEPDNEVDKEAIMIEMEGLGQVGYVQTAPTPLRAKVSAPAGSMIKSETPPKAPFSMFCPKACFAILKRILILRMMTKKIMTITTNLKMMPKMKKN